MKIESWPIDRPKDYPANARKWSDQAVAKVASSIKTFGFVQPVVVDKKGVIIIGHLRRAAARTIPLTHIPVHVASKLTPAQVRQLRLMDNRSHEEAQWDQDILTAEMLDLQGLDLDLSLTGFSERELDAMLRTENPAEDDVPPVPVAPVSRLGDLWLLGEHRVLCGDSTDAGAVARLLGGQKAPFLMVTDPPYGVDYDPEWRAPHNWDANKTATGRVANDDRVDWSPAFKLFPGAVAYIWHSGNMAGESAISVASCDFQIRAQIIWAKQTSVFGRGAYHWKHEPCWYAVRRGQNAHWTGDRTQTTVWDVQNLNPMGGNRDETATGHGTQKPVEIMRRPILNHTVSGDTVYDPFLGSGTTVIAAESIGRICYGLEIDPLYADIIVTRWQTLTGKQATLDGRGATFEQTRDGRRLEAQDAIKEEVLVTLAR